MTGLDPSQHVIVEIATLVTDDDLNIVAYGPELVIQASQEELSKMDEVVYDMHSKSGLLTKIQESNINLKEATKQTLDFISKYVEGPGIVPLCGNSIGMDRRFLAIHMPEIENFLNYRSIDVSTLKELARRWHPKLLSLAPQKQSGHRALDDVIESVNELRFYRETMLSGKATQQTTTAQPSDHKV